MLYYYDKYSIKEVRTGVESTFGWDARWGSSSKIKIFGSDREPQFTIEKGFEFIDTPADRTPTNSSHVIYEIISSGNILLRWSNYEGMVDGYYYITKHSKRAILTKSKSVLLESNIIAEDGTYPNDGALGAYWYVKKSVVNNPPTISGANSNLGNLTAKPTPISYTLTDTDADTLTVTEKIDGRVVRTFTATSGTSYTLQLTDDQWLKTRLNTSVNMTVDVSDGKGGIATRTHTLTRKETKIEFQLKTPFKTDVLAKRILLNLSGKVPLTATVLVEACNNALDTTPTWENITALCLRGLPYPFVNKTKTNTFGGVSFRVKIERGTSTEEIYLTGVGGAFD